VEAISLTGTVKSIGFYRPDSQKRDVLLILTEGEYYCMLSFDISLKKVLFVKNLTISFFQY